MFSPLSLQTTWERMQKRGRPEVLQIIIIHYISDHLSFSTGLLYTRCVTTQEQDVALDYLKSLHEKHEKWLLDSENKMK